MSTNRPTPIPVSRPTDVNLNVKPITVNVTVTHAFGPLKIILEKKHRLAAFNWKESKPIKT